MPPKRNPRHLDALRIEVNDRERDLIEQAIIGNTVGKVAQGVGNMFSGMGLGFGIFAAAVVFIEGVETVTKWFEHDRAKWDAANLTQARYDAYIQTRTDEWIAAAKADGRYEPAIGDEANKSWWRKINPLLSARHKPLTYAEWERQTYGKPPMLFDEWSNSERAKATREREKKLGYGWLKDVTEWLGTKVPDSPLV